MDFSTACTAAFVVGMGATVGQDAVALLGTLGEVDVAESGVATSVGCAAALYIAGRSGGRLADDLQGVIVAVGGMAAPKETLLGVLAAGTASLVCDFWTCSRERGLYRTVFALAASCLCRAKWAFYTDVYHTFERHSDHSRPVALLGAAAVLLAHMLAAFAAADCLAATQYYIASGWRVSRAVRHCVDNLVTMRSATTFVLPAAVSVAVAATYAYREGFPTEMGFFAAWW